MGGFLVALLRKNYFAIGIDYNRDYCKITKLRSKRYKLCAPVLQAAGESLPLKDSCVDIITCFDVLEHVQNPYDVLKEIYRVLKPNGIAIVTVINRFAFKDPHYHLKFINWIPRGVAEQYIKVRNRVKNSPCKDRQRLSEMHYFTFKKFKRLAESIGFRVEDLTYLKISDASKIKDKKMRKIVNILKIIRLNTITYTLLRYFYLPNFTIVLTKKAQKG